jgi:hypothetical protein
MSAQFPDGTSRSFAAGERLGAEVENELARLRRELTEARAEKVALSDIPRVIAHSPTNMLAALQAIVETAARLCDSPGASLAQIRERDGRLAPRVSTAASGSASRSSIATRSSTRPESSPHGRHRRAWP